jgi:hypothetical protein
LPALERGATGMKAGDEKKSNFLRKKVSAPYDAKKRKTVSKSELPAWTQKGDVLLDRAGQEPS